jgi:hypothetical protein
LSIPQRLRHPWWWVDPVSDRSSSHSLEQSICFRTRSRDCSLGRPSAADVRPEPSICRARWVSRGFGRLRAHVPGRVGLGLVAAVAAGDDAAIEVPTPASPRTTATQPRPAATRSSNASAWRSSTSRPTSASPTPGIDAMVRVVAMPLQLWRLGG